MGAGRGRAKLLRGARVTAAGAQVGAVVCVKRKGMKEEWCLATSFDQAPAWSAPQFSDQLKSERVLAARR
ncbi:hypothetical protein BHS05_04625 [Myxococcus xanthus]|uniref:Uncharacterized protein n=1 Tax=Myxococcus xanthus TaxID=34 RepID=A0AAE6FWL8_MYXXA|nr:hypothetical protein BHS09_04590 [Myxococcus xanthus]QDE73604.1 hypothetical protein BHS08_04595 [Myxococcus xanthus]QDE95200.1 hypothetical protein BHS05_04625 [Myxococcus xanthus]